MDLLRLKLSTSKGIAFSETVYRAVREVDTGSVTTLGHIAGLVGKPGEGRRVGVSLGHLAKPYGALLDNFTPLTVPWHRVVDDEGTIPHKRTKYPGGPKAQAQALRDEGVEVTATEEGELRVDLGTYGWFPEQLPSVARVRPESGGHGGKASGVTDGAGAGDMLRK